MPYIVGLTGGIGSGKTTIANLFAELDVPLIDADIVSRQIVEKGTPCFSRIVARFGDHILTQEGELDRVKLRQLIFSNETEKNWLNQLLHPAIRQEMLAQLQGSKAPYQLFVVPLLIENNLTELCDRILVVDVKLEIQLERALKRDRSNLDTIKNIIKAQVSRETRLRYAQDVIENNKPLEEGELELKRQVRELNALYLHLAKEKIEKNNV